MKIALISSHTFSKPGGVKSHILGLYHEFKKKGLRVKIILPRRDSKENYGKDFIFLGTSFPFPFSGSESDLWVTFNPSKISKVLEKEKFDVLHFHNFGVPSSIQILEKSDSLNILTFHGDLKGSYLIKKFPGIFSFLKKMNESKVDGLIAVAPLVMNFFKEYKGPKTIIPNGIDIKEFNPNLLKLKKFDDDKVNILFVGRIEKRKGLIYLLRAYKILSKKSNNIRLIVVGEGGLKKECQDWTRKNKLKRVYFEGERTGKELPLYYSTCDIFVSPAIFGESFGIVLLEAMASGKPVVGFANRGYKQLMQGKLGEKFLVKPKDYKSLAKKIEILIKGKELRKTMGQWGRSEAEKYSWSNIANSVVDFYEICQKKKKMKENKSFFQMFKDSMKALKIEKLPKMNLINKVNVVK